MLMELLSDAWGVDPRGEGKSIWFELYEPDGAEPDGAEPSGSESDGSGEAETIIDT
jgi:hypothetical protein